MAETELDKQTVLVTDLTRKVDELQVRADEATRLKDQLDEHVSYISCVLSLPLFNWVSTGIDMQLISSKRRRTSWRSTRRSCRKLRTCANKSR